MTSSSSPLLFEAENLTKVLTGKTVLNVPFLSVEPGNIYAFIGPNGSGKTTLLKILGLLMSPTSGTLTFNGECVKPEDRSAKACRRRMTMVSQQPYLFHSTVGKNIDYGLKIRNVSRAGRKSLVRECLRKVRLDEEFLHRSAQSLSGGETKRVAIARALAIDPDVLFLDEPMANVDSSATPVLENVIRELRERNGRTILITGHYLGHAYRLTDHVYTLKEGKLCTARFENFFHGSFTRKNGEAWFDTGRLSIRIPPFHEPHRCVSIKPRHILISTQPFPSNNGNNFAGVISGVRPEGDIVQVEVDVGEHFQAEVSRHLFEQLRLKAGDAVNITFRTTDVHLM